MGADNQAVDVSGIGTEWDAGDRDGIVCVGANCSLHIHDGATVAGDGGFVSGLDLSVTGPGARLILTGDLSVDGANFHLTLGPNAVAQIGGLNVNDMTATSTINISGSLFATNASRNALLDLFAGNVLTNSGILVADQIQVEDTSIFSFSDGTVKSGQMLAINNSAFTVGDGLNTANYIMQGGTHSFASGMVISSNSVLSGCGTVIGNVTNYGLIILTNGCDMIFSNTVVNLGSILALNGTIHFQSAFINNGTFFQNTARVTGLAFSGSDVTVQFSTVANYLHDVQARNDLATGSWTSLTNGPTGNGGVMTTLDSGGATNGQRFYRVLLHY
jgi:hypothetical protein